MLSEVVLSQLQVSLNYRDITAIEAELIVFSCDNNLSILLEEHKKLVLEIIKNLIPISNQNNWSHEQATLQFHTAIKTSITKSNQKLLDPNNTHLVDDWSTLLLYYALCCIRPQRKELSQEEQKEMIKDLGKELQAKIPNFIASVKTDKDLQDLPKEMTITFNTSTIAEVFRIVIAYAEQKRIPNAIAQFPYLSESQARKHIEGIDDKAMFTDMTNIFTKLFSHQLDKKLFEICLETIGWFLTHSPRRKQKDLQRLQEEHKKELDSLKTKDTSKVLGIKSGRHQDSGEYDRSTLIHEIRQASKQLRDKGENPTLDAVAHKMNNMDKHALAKLLKEHDIDPETSKNLRYNF